VREELLESGLQCGITDGLKWLKLREMT